MIRTYIAYIACGWWLLLGQIHHANAQGVRQVADSVTLQYCYNQTLKNYPLQRQKNLMHQETALKQANLQVAHKPQLFLNASAVYVSDVPSLPIELPGGAGMPELSKDRYQVTLDINQSIYDGGNTKRRLEVARHQLKSNQQQIEVKLYGLKAKVNELYFGVLMLQAREQTLAVLDKNLQNNLKLIKARIKNGVLLPSDSSLIKAELIQVHQQIQETEYNRRASLATLGRLMQTTIPTTTYLKVPALHTLPAPQKRPEYQLFEYQKKSLQAMEKVVSTQNKPRVMAFAQLGYGRPGLNFLSNDFEAYYQFGVKLNWRIWDWGSRGRSLEQLKIKQALVQNQQEVFETNQQVKSERFDYQVSKLQELLKRDEEIIQLRRQIVQSAKAQMKNGVITTTQYLTLLNQSTQAEIRKQMHEIELLKTKVDDATLQGKR